MPQMIYSRNNIFCANEMFRVTIFFAQTKYFATQYFLRNIPRHNIVMPRTISFITTPKRRYFFIISFMRYYITKQTRYFARKYCSSNSTHEVSRKTECYSSKNNISLEQNDRINIDFINKLANNAALQNISPLALYTNFIMLQNISLLRQSDLSQIYHNKMYILYQSNILFLFYIKYIH